MTLVTLSLLLASACIHVVTHILLKGAGRRSAFVWWMLGFALLLFAPLVLLLGGNIPWVGWLAIVASSVFEASYFMAIARAYDGGDLSVVYPLARGTAPVFLLLWSVALLREGLRPGGMAGVAIIAGGLYMINLPRASAWRRPLQRLVQAGPRWALLAGLSTSAYTAIDKVGIRSVAPLLYTYTALLVTLGWMTPLTWRMMGWQGMKAELRRRPWAPVLAGLTSMAAYVLVLLAMQLGAPAGYAGAVREFSVVLGAGYGVLILKESRSRMRIFGAALVAAGVSLIGWLG
jgi:drug/metabolite transporter (DMT)-like permease